MSTQETEIPGTTYSVTLSPEQRKLCINWLKDGWNDELQDYYDTPDSKLNEHVLGVLVILRNLLGLDPNVFSIQEGGYGNQAVA